MSRNFGLKQPPDVPRREVPGLDPGIKTLPRVHWADVGLSFMAGAICTLLGFLACVYYFQW